MIAELIGLNSELFLKQNYSKTVSLFKELRLIGIDMKYHEEVGENRVALQNALARALQRSDLVFVSGGLGFESQNLAKTVLCEGLSLTTVVHEQSLRDAKAYCAEMGIPFSQTMSQQAMLPQGAQVFTATVGSAPGCAVSSGSQAVLLLPAGFDRFLQMFAGQVYDYLSRFTSAASFCRNMRLFGLTEKEVTQRLEDFFQMENPVVTHYTQGEETLLRVCGRAESRERAGALCTPCVKSISERLGDYLYGVDIEKLEQAVVYRLREKRLTLSTAESATAGLISKRISSVAGASEVHSFTVASTSAKTKQQVLSVSEKLLKKYGSVSAQAAAAMAVGVQQAGESALGLAVTGVSSENAAEAEAGYVYAALADEKNVWVRRFSVPSNTKDREQILHSIASQALNLVRLYLLHTEKLQGMISTKEAQTGKWNETAVLAAVTTGAAASDKMPKENLPWYKRLAHGIFPMRGDDPREIVRKLALIVLLLVFFGSTGYIVNYYYQSYANQKLSGELESVYLQGGNGEIPEGYPEDYLLDFAGLYSINTDVIGWLQIPDTLVNYPVVQTTDNTYYERRDFTKAHNDHGVPFMDYRDDVRNSDNVIIYGHNMRDGQMFGDLIKYRNDLQYYQEHPLITFNSVYENAKYKIISTFIANVNSEHGTPFQYHNFINAGSDEDFMDFVDEVKKRSLITTTVDVQPGDQLLTLSTCTYEFDNARFVIVARKVRPGENEEVDVNQARINSNALMPDIWYQLYGGSYQGDSQGTTTSIDEPSSSDGTLSSSSSFESSSSEFVSSMDGSSSSEIASSSSETSSSEQGSSSEQSSSSSSSASSSQGSSSSSSGSSEHSSSSGGASSSETPNEDEPLPPPNFAPSVETLRVNLNNLDTGSTSYSTRMNARELIYGVVQAEVGSSFHTEAIKAQAVASYTYIKHSNQVGNSVPTVNYRSPSSKVKNAVDSVFGQAIYYNGQLIQSVYHSQSAGATNDSRDVWGQNLPYLKSVDSIDGGSYQLNATYSRSQVVSMLDSKLGIDLSGETSNPSTWFQVSSYTSGGYNANMRIAGYSTLQKSCGGYSKGSSITGRLLREQVFSLRSACFRVEYNASTDQFQFYTNGYGHGVGMSQTGANLYAARGWSYKDILTHYYSGVSVW